MLKQAIDVAIIIALWLVMTAILVLVFRAAVLVDLNA